MAGRQPECMEGSTEGRRFFYFFFGGGEGGFFVFILDSLLIFLGVCASGKKM